MSQLNDIVSQRKKGLSSSEIRQKLEEDGVEEAQIQFYLQKSDELFFNQMMSPKKTETASTNNATKVIKIITLILCLLLLISIFLGYITTGLLGLLIIWILIRYSSF
ncbi:hypothetical protein LX97_03112 [Nonlabens dokdonensis]|jgi:hypothetical protein|uniref:Uncharacterized protein n=2 Tax=Nonlabens dokdonensis TaxID=328515 RepID=L7WCQ1_NONDD|nr:hypothetical protein [Nonlabens dokdonensis]AGC78022.1 hypothetical protein DDD_2895 [Nonlabens dokdonensis DSW-6]PZX37090.1 hypothetical protein LX97_03112 [Nonlabens dokdonensis]